MTVRWVTVLLVAVVVVGGAGQFAGTGTTAEFSDAHDGTGNVTAASNFGGGGGGPRADAGGPYTVEEGGSVWLDASGSRGNIQSYEWSIISGPGGGFYYPSSGYGVFEAPDDVNGTTETVLELTVTGNNGRTDTDTVVVTITDTDGSGNSLMTTSGASVSSSGATRDSRTTETFGNTTR